MISTTTITGAILVLLGTAPIAPVLFGTEHAQSVCVANRVHSIGDNEDHAFKWTGNCSIQCDNGQCKAVCRSGIVYSHSEKDAKIRATADFEAQASEQGSIVGGTVRVVVEF